MYYIPYQEQVKKINLLYVFYLYGIATYNKETKLKDTINYQSISELTRRISQQYKVNISDSTIDRFLKKIPIFYENYFIINFSKKQIRLRNYFKGKKKARFITLSERAFETLTSLNDDLLCKYYCFLRFECGKHPNGTDRTAKQILEAMGYSSKSGNYQSRLSEYNRILTASQLIKINKQRDGNGNERNIYHL